jgi:hypothetical protein
MDAGVGMLRNEVKSLAACASTATPISTPLYIHTPL